MKRYLYAHVNNYGSRLQIFDVVGITDKETKFPIKVDKNNFIYVDIENKDKGNCDKCSNYPTYCSVCSYGEQSAVCKDAADYWLAEDEDHGNCEKCDNYRCRRGISMKSKNTEKRLDYISQVASMKSQNWGDYGWLVSEEWENIPVDIQTRIQTILRRDFIEKEVNSIKE